MENFEFKTVEKKESWKLLHHYFSKATAIYSHLIKKMILRRNTITYALEGYNIY